MWLASEGRVGTALLFGCVLVIVLSFVLRRHAASVHLQLWRTELSATLWLVASGAWLWLAGFVALVIRARLRLGFWPYGNYIEPGKSSIGGWHPAPLDPAELGPHYGILAFSLMASPLALLLVAIVAIVSSSVLSRREIGSATVFAIGGAALVFASIVFDPCGFYAWFRD